MALRNFVSKSLGLALVAVLSLASLPAWATPFATPSTLSGLAGPDIDGSGYFNAGGQVLSVELFDLAGTILPAGTDFGFYFRGAAGTQVSIFDALDQASPEQKALIDFDNGTVIDVDGNVLQQLFTPNHSDPIGFFMHTDALGTLFSDASLNAGGLDVFGAFESLTLPNRFYTLFVGNGPQGFFPLQIALTGEISAVPSPSVLSLLALAFLIPGLVKLARRPGRMSMQL